MLKAIYDSKDSIPEAFRELYSERDGKWEVTGIEGVKTQGDMDRVNGALARAKSERDEARSALTKRGEATPEQVTGLEDQVAELETKLKMAGKTPEDFESKLSELADRRAATKVAPVQRELEQAKAGLTERDTKIVDLTATVQNRDIDDVLRSAAAESKVERDAVNDVLMHRGVFERSETGDVVSRDGVGVTPGISPTQWLEDRKKDRSHWWAPSQGGGATGAGANGGIGDNPWSKKSWNVTKQGEAVRTHGAEKAAALAKAAGSVLGATAPPSDG